MSKHSTILVTGGTGFVGRYIVDELVATGAPVVSYNRDYAQHPDALVTCVQGELFDLPVLVRAINEHGVTTIIHTAGMSDPDFSIALPITTVAANVNGTLMVFEAARMTSVRRIVNFSSECVYGHQPDDTFVTEAAALVPNTPYGVTKVATEHLGRVYNDRYGLDVVSLRVSEVYGPGLRLPQVLKNMLRAAVDGEAFEMTTGGDHRFHFVHVRDVAAAALLAAAATNLSQPVYNICGGEQVSLFGLSDRIRRSYPRARIELGAGFSIALDRQGPWDISAAARDLGYAPDWPLDRGLPDYAEWLTDHRF
jgi:nucleoside-diphosphate-sugar epimerase